MICPSLRFNASSHTGEAYSLQSEGPQIRDCTESSPLSARNVLRSALFFNLLQNLDHAPLGRYLLQSKGAQIRDCTGWYPFTASIIHRYVMSFISFSKRHAIMGSLPAAIRRTSDQRLHRVVPLFLQASISALICPSLRFKDSRHTGELLAAI